jgi:hypothetical protein
MNFRKWADDMSTRETACGSKEFDPLSRFPQRKAGAGMVPPTPLHVPRQPKPLARPMLRLPPQEGFQKRSAEPPLRDPPGLASADVRPPDGRPVAKMIARGKELRMAATSSLTFTTFS